jgi:CheY-like chemotaxis protein
MSTFDRGLDLFSAVAAAAEGVAGTLRRDAVSAVLFWGDHLEAEVVHTRDVPADVTRALGTAGGRYLADVMRASGQPLRITTGALPDGARELRTALQSSRIGSLAVFPMFGERGVVGCLVVPFEEGEPAPTRGDAGWRVACRTLQGLQLTASTAALRAALHHDRRSPAELYEGVLVVDRWERVLLADGLFRDFPGWNREDPFGRPLDGLPGFEILTALQPGASESLRWEEHLLPPIEGHGVPVGLAAVPLDGDDADGGRIIFLRDLRPEKGSSLDGTSRMLALGLRVAHAADEVSQAIDLGKTSPGIRSMSEWAVDRLEAEVAAALELVDEVLERCLSAEERAKVQLNELIERVLYRYKEALEYEHIRVFTFLRPDLPPVPGERIPLERAVRRLIQSARESLTPGGGSLTARTWMEEGWVYAAVSDDGAGRKGHDSEHIGELLFSSPDVEPEEELDAVRKILEQMGGRLLIESRPGVWTRVTFMLRQERRRTQRPARGLPPAVKVTRESEGLSVLVVDDNAALRSVLRRYLERRGHEVTEAVDGEDGLRILRGREFDRVVVDIQMPGKDGPEFFEGLRTVSPVMRDRTIFMTGGFLEGGTERFINESGRPSIKKPFDLAEMAKTVED